MEQIILGTAGHIDHGKTSLVKAVTGTDTDRLKEEKLRGITIELGFASLDLPNRQHLGIVDVPGHEKFVKNMVAGAAGIDIVAMVIAADEGVMPQTREHMEICTLLGIQHGLVVLTKIDMVDEEWLELVTEDIREFVQGTFLENTPIVSVSSITNDGIQDFIATLEELCAKIPKRPPSDIFRLPVDRVFTMKGFGTVITGSLVSGNVKTGDTIMVYPPEIKSKVRGIQVHNESVEEALAGMRTAINFQGLDRTAVNRGDVLAMPGTLRPSYMIDVSLTYLETNEKPAKNRDRVRFHSGTSEIMGMLILLDRDEMKPGECTEAQLHLDSPVSCIRDDRFVLRSYSPVRTIGGGSILNPIPPKHKRFRPEIIDGLKMLAKSTAEETIPVHISQSGYTGVSFAELRLMVNMSEKHLMKTMDSILSRNVIVLADKENRIYVHNDIYENMKNKILSLLTQFHQANPLKEGMGKEELKSKFPKTVGVKLFNHLINRMIKTKEIMQDDDTIRLAEHAVSLGADQEDIRGKILDVYKNDGLTPPFVKDLCKNLDIDPGLVKDVLTLLVKDGLLIKIREDFYIFAETLEMIKNRLTGFLEEKGEITTPQFKEMTGASRKYVIPLIEYFDSSKITIRIGDIRKLRTG